MSLANLENSIIVLSAGFGSRPFLAYPKNVTSFGSATELVISRRAFLGAVAKFVKIGSTFECGSERRCFLVIPENTTSCCLANKFVITRLAISGVVAKFVKMGNVCEYGVWKPILSCHPE